MSIDQPASSRAVALVVAVMLALAAAVTLAPSRGVADTASMLGTGVVADAQGEPDGIEPIADSSYGEGQGTVETCSTSAIIGKAGGMAGGAGGAGTAAAEATSTEALVSEATALETAAEVPTLETAATETTTLETLSTETSATRAAPGRSFPEIETPHGVARQHSSPGALAARQEVGEGATVWRTGTTGRSQAAEAQFWTTEHPSTPGFAGRYGIPPENVANADFIELAVVRPGSPFVTRPAPAVGPNPGGGIEVVVPEGGVQMCGFSWIGPKGGC
jgi:hypothetical protein